MSTSTPKEREQALAESAEQLGEMGSWEFVPETDELIWSDNCFRLLGLEPNEAEPTPELLLELTHPDDRQGVEDEIQRIRSGAGNQHYEGRIIRWDREVRHLLSTITAVDAEPHRVIGHLQDITERRQAEREIKTHIEVANALGTWESLERSGESLLRALGEALEFVAGAIWVPQAELLVPRKVWVASSVDVPKMELVFNGRELARGSALPGRAWASGEPVSHHGPAGDLAEIPGAARAGLRSAVAFPAPNGGEVLAVVTFYSREEFAFTDRLMEAYCGIGRELGHVLDRCRGELGSATLTPRELEVLQLASLGNSSPNIAEELLISRDTVKTHFRHIYSKLEVHDRAMAVAQGLRLGLIN